MKSLALRTFSSCLRGASNISYSIVTGLVAVISIGAINGTGGAIVEIFETAVEELEGAGKANENASETGQNQSANALPDIIDVIVPPDGEYFPGETLTFTIVFSKKVNVKEGAYIQIDIGGEIRHATYVSGAHTTDIVFEYVITEDDLDTDGIELPETEIEGGDGEDGGGGVEGGDGDFTDKDPDTGGIIVPGAKTCTVNCAYIGLADGTIMKLADDGSPIWEKKAMTGSISAIAIDPAGGVYVAGGSSYVRKYDFEGNLKWTRQGAFGDVMDLAVSPAGDLIVGAEMSGNVYVYDTDGYYQGRNNDTKTEEGYYPGMDTITGVVAAETGNAAFAVSQYGQFTKIDLDTMETIWSTRTLSRYLNGVAVGNSGHVYPGGWDIDTQDIDGFSYEYVYEFADLPNGYFLNTGWRHMGRVRDVAVSKDGLIAVTTGIYSPFTANYLYAFKQGQEEQIWRRTEVGQVNEMAFDDDGNLWLAYETQKVRVRAPSGVQIGYTFSFDQPVRAIAVNRALGE